MSYKGKQHQTFVMIDIYERNKWNAPRTECIKLIRTYPRIQINFCSPLQLSIRTYLLQILALFLLVSEKTKIRRG